MNLLYLLRRARDRFGDRPATITNDGSQTWREFYKRVEHAAAYLLTQDLERGDRVAILLSNGPDYLELYYALPVAGLIAVPLNNRWAVDDFAFSISDSGPKVLITDDRYAPIAEQIRARVPELRIMKTPLGAADCTEPYPEPAADDIMGVFYTSGTTGGPKGAMLTHNNLCSNAILSHASGMNLGSVYLHAAPMFHLADGAATHVATMTGAAHAFIPVFDPGAFLDAVERHRVTSSILVPTMINMVVNHPCVDSADLSSLDRILYGASPMPVSLLQTAMQKLKCKFQQAYGMTETSPVQTMLQPEDHRFENLDRTFSPVRSAGRPILGMEVQVVDVEDRELPAGEIGEIVARGPNVMKGYWNRPEITREVLRGGWMHTGDMGAFDANGFLYILDRKKDMIKTGGENVYSPEVESMIVSHPDVVEAAVIGVPDVRWGETIRAVAVLRSGSALTEHDLIEYCRAHMTHFKCPTSVVFVVTLPKGGTGKVQKNALRRMYGGASSATTA
jgi:long-chain acyl-CoA synthetase